MKHVMVDLETLGNGPQSVIIAIGAVEFDPDVGAVSRMFEYRIDPQSCIDAGLKMDASTVMWWMQQSDEARSVFKSDLGPLVDALEDFAEWYPKGAPLWGNGATFDNVILANAYKSVKLKQPWKYTDDRCYRTLKNLLPHINQEAVGVKHNAVDDARYQALHAIKLLNAMKGV